MTASVLKNFSLNGSPVCTGEAVDVDANTFANLSRKGWLAAVDTAGSLPKEDGNEEKKPKSKTQKP